MKKLCLAVFALAITAVSAGNVKFSSALLPKNVNVSYQLEELISKPGEKDKFKTIDPAKANIGWKEEIKQRGNATDIKITITNKSDKPRFLQVSAAASNPFAKFDWWNGYVSADMVKFDPADKILSTWFPASAAIGEKNALILGLDPLMLCSRVVSQMSKKNELLVALPVYLEPGKSFDANFTVAAVPAKYGYHDVIQAWYDLFPVAYQPAKDIAPQTISGEASYMYWKPGTIAGPHQYDLLRRFYGGRGCWEWCYKPFIRAGDWSITDKWSVGWRKHSKARVEGVRKKTAARLAPAAENNVAPMWYVNVCWTEKTIFEKHFPGIATDSTRARRSWGQEAVTPIYCWGTDYGKLFLQGLTEVPVKFPASRGIGWDSCFAHREFPETHAGFKGTDPKSFENGKPLVLEAVGISHLLDHARKQFAGKYRMANAVNFKLVSPFMIGVRTDAGLYEGNPMGDIKRLHRIESMRARLGSPKALAWHKLATPDRIKWVDWDDMTKAEAQDAYRQIMDNILFLSFYWGGVPAPKMPTTGVKKLIDHNPVLIDLIRQGWQPSPAVDVPQTILAARYGKGAGAGIVVINPDYKAQTFEVNFPAPYWENKAALVTGDANQTISSVLSKAGTEVKLTLPARSLTVLRVCGLLEVPTEVTVRSEKVEESGKEAFHRFNIKTAGKFQSKIEFGRLAADTAGRISCEDDLVRFKAGEKFEYTIDTGKWIFDVQEANLQAGTLSLIEYPKYATAEVEKETMIAFDLPAKAKAGKLFLVPVKETKAAVNAISEWVNFCTWDKYGAASPAVTGTPAADAVVIKLEVNPDELKYHQQGRALIEDNVIRIIGRTAADLEPLVNVTLNRFDAAYPIYGKLPVKDKSLQKIGLAGKVLEPAPVKRPLRPTLLEMMKRNRIHSRTGK